MCSVVRENAGLTFDHSASYLFEENDRVAKAP